MIPYGISSSLITSIKIYFNVLDTAEKLDKIERIAHSSKLKKKKENKIIESSQVTSGNCNAIVIVSICHALFIEKLKLRTPSYGSIFPHKA